MSREAGDRLARSLAFAAIAAGTFGALALGAGCGTAPPDWPAADAGMCMPYMPPTNMNLATPTISFKTNVMPILAANCQSSVCHGIASSPQGGLFLGAELQHGADAATVYTGLVGKMSGQLKSMPFVTAGDPTNSYLMHKLDADQCVYEAQCVNHNCFKPMPYDTAALTVDNRDTIRRWIAQGAPNN